MKSLIVRLSVLTLAATGFAASTASTKTSKNYDVKPVVFGTVNSAPMCPPDGSKGWCGMH